MLFGIISLLADASYEGFRGILAPLIRSSYELGAVVGAGDLIAWSFRPVTGILADLTASYWSIVAIGYSLIPIGVFIAVQGWPWLVIGYSIERFGKALRTPARDALISSIAGKRRGFVFGLHEALDQAGAVVGPVIAALGLAGLYGLWVLAIPGALTIPILAYLSRIYPGTAVPRHYGRLVKGSLRGGFSAALYVLAAGAVTANPIAVQAVVKAFSYLSKEQLVLLYSTAMLGDAIAALPLGMLYDKSPRIAQVAPPVLGILAGIAVLTLGRSLGGAVLASVLSGAAIAGYETVARAMVRGGAAGYGIFGASYGAASAASIILYGFLARLVA